MRFGLNRAFGVVVTALLIFVSGNSRFGVDIVDARAAQPTVRIAEFHYDNAGTDTGEAIEISAPAGTDLAGWQIVLYNGNGGAVYNTRVLGSVVVPATCGARGVVVQNYPANGIQNGDPDAIALVDPSGAVVEFLSYGGAFTGVGGPAAGKMSTDIGIKEPSTTPIGQSLQRDGAGVWSGPKPNTFGTCNDSDEPPPAEVATVTVAPTSATIFVDGTQTFTASAFDSAGNPIAGVTFAWRSSNDAVATVTAAGLVTGETPGQVTITAEAPNGVEGTATVQVDALPPPGPVDVRFSELHYDNAGADANEAIEIEGPAGTNLAGWSVVLYNGNGGGVYNTRGLTGSIPASCGARGVVVLTYPPDGIQNGAPDGMALVNGEGQVVEFLSYEGSFPATNGPAAGMTSIDILANQNSAPVGRSLQRYMEPVDEWASNPNTFGVCNGARPAITRSITITGRNLSDPALPVGYQDQLFATLTDSTGAEIPTTFTWASEAPAIASIDAFGVFTALAEGTAVLRATAADGTTRTIALPTHVAQASTTALYVGNAEFGEPADNDPSDDFIVRHPQFTASYNAARGTSNWVAYELDPTHFGPEDRCDCFTFDPALPAAFTRYTTADYTGAGTFHGYGIDRGHLARSFDRTSGSLDNARTFLFTNIIPQAGDLNQGPWADFEAYLGNLAMSGGKEVYIVTGVAGSKGTVKNEGKIVIPASTWKVAVIMPHDFGLANVADYRDLEVIAVNMPNDPGIRNVDWETYKTTVDAIEALTGYDLLALLDDKTENAVESNTKPPFAVVNGPFTSAEGSALAMDAGASFDPNGTVTNYQWLFGDGGSASGPSVSHTYTQDGTYTVTLVVTDNDGLTDTITTTATVTNVAPVLAALAGASLLPGETYTTSGSFTDPGSDTWSATVDYGDGSGAAPLALSGQAFSLSHTYTSPGTFTVTVVVDDGAASASTTATVTVLSVSDAIGQAIAAIDALTGLNPGVANSLKAKLNGAVKNLADGQVNGALGKLQAAINELDALVRSGRLTDAQAAPIRTLLMRAIDSLS